MKQNMIAPMEMAKYLLLHTLCSCVISFESPIFNSTGIKDREQTGADSMAETSVKRILAILNFPIIGFLLCLGFFPGENSSTPNTVCTATAGPWLSRFSSQSNIDQR